MPKKIPAMVVVMLLALSFAGAASAADISELLSSGKAIKVYIKGFKNLTGDPELPVGEFTSMVARSLENRKTNTFVMADSPEKSEIEISGEIKSYNYMERGPMKPSISLTGLLLDAAATMTENYVDMEAVFVVTESATGQVLWEQSIAAYVKRIMTASESVGIIYDKLARTFIWRAFGKHRKMFR